MPSTSPLLLTQDDILIHVFSYLEPPEILLMRRVCSRLHTLSYLRIVWMNACTTHILKYGYPFPAVQLGDIFGSELERRTCHAFRLSQRWLSGPPSPRKAVVIDATSNTSVSDVRLVPGHDGRYLLTVSKSVWSALTIWDVAQEPRKCYEWSPRGAIFNGFTLNTDHTSQAFLAISVLNNGEQRVEMLSLVLDGSDASLKELFSLQSTHTPITLKGDLLALSDEASETTIWNWKEDTYAILQEPPDDGGIWKRNHCIQLVFAYQSILVVRARSIHLYSQPKLGKGDDLVPFTHEPIANYSFGWVDGVSVTSRSPLFERDNSLYILIRPESDDPWSSHVHHLELYAVQRNRHFEGFAISKDSASFTGEYDTETSQSITLESPYIFPPTRVSRVHSMRGHLRCTDIILGQSGTALWVQPQDQTVAGLLWSEDDSMTNGQSSDAHESLVATVFPGPLKSDNDEESSSNLTSANPDIMEGTKLYTNDCNNWTSLDYDEQLGQIALGSGFGKVLILHL